MVPQMEMVQVHDRDAAADVPTSVPPVPTTNPPSHENLHEVSRKNVISNSKSGHRRGIYMKSAWALTMSVGR